MDEERWKHAEDETALTAVDETLLSNVFRCKKQR